MLALGMLLKQMGKYVDLVTADRVPANCNTLSWNRSHTPGDAGPCGSYDAAILLECDGLARAKLSMAWRSSSSSISITTLAVPRLCPLELDRRRSDQRGRADPTGWLQGGQPRHRYARDGHLPLCHGAHGHCGLLLRHHPGLDIRLGAGSRPSAGADPIRIAQDVCFSTSTAKMLLLGVALGNLKREGPLGWLWVTHQDMIRTGFRRGGLRGHCESCRVHLRRVEAAAFLRELPEGNVRLSLRSKGKVNAWQRSPDSWAAGAMKNWSAASSRGPWIARSTRFWQNCAGPWPQAVPKKPKIR